MRISRRTSGGRGEYELSGVLANGDGVQMALQSHITIAFPDGITIHTRIKGVMQGGKPRLRMDGAEIHIQKQLAATFMMPDPVRQTAALGAGEPVMQTGAYGIEHIEIDDLMRIDPHTIVIDVHDVTIVNRSNHGEEIDLRERARMLREVWNRSDEFPDEIASLIDDHQKHVTNGFVGTAVESMVAQLQRLVSERSVDLGIVYSERGDVLPKLADALHYQVAQPLIDVDRIDPEDLVLKRRAVKEWKRWANARGPASAKFRQQVRTAYNSTCAICGAHYPRTPYTSSAGIDAAHILPWSSYDLDEVFNGLCLCKTHHWAFDEGILLIRFVGGKYRSEIESGTEENINSCTPDFSWDKLQDGIGTIAESRLPSDSSLWPHPDLLAQLAEAY